MKTSPVTPDDLRASVLAVPPLARTKTLSIDRSENHKLIRHVEAGGVSTFIYGGNANLYNVGVSEYSELLSVLEEGAAAASWMIPSVGPDFGKSLDQLRILRGRDFPTAMVLPSGPPATPAGVARGLRLMADAFGRPLIVYIKAENYLDPKELGQLAKAGAVCAVKYAVTRQRPAEDDYLRRILDHLDRSIVVSGMGERPAIVHLQEFGLASFTSGLVCLAPDLSASLLGALQRGDWAAAEQLRQRFIPLEDLRDEINPIRVLHEAVTLANIGDMGEHFPMLSALASRDRERVVERSRALAG